MRRTATYRSAIPIGALLLFFNACTDAAPVEPSLRPMLQQVDLAGKGGRRLVCPVREAQWGSARIGPEGGVLRVADHEIRIPPGALMAPTNLLMTVPAGRYVWLDITAGSQARFEFALPVLITISYSRCNQRLIAGWSPTAWYVDGESGALIERMSASHDAENRSVTFQTRHLSTYAVAY